LSSPNVISQPMTALAHTSESDCRTRTTSEHYTANESWTRTKYTYDPVGNRLTNLGSANWTYNTSNELSTRPNVSYTYDANGNTLTEVTSAGTTTFTWDFENRLTNVALPGGGGTVGFKYDPFGRRIYKSSSAGTSIYAYDGFNLTEEVNSTGTAAARYTQTQNVDEPLAMLRSGTTSYYQVDGLGSVTSLSNASGALAQTYAFDSFGNQTASSGSLVNSFRYTGREFDSETNLYYYRARYIDPATGRFISEDPIGFSGGSNFYRYARNNPVRRKDPSGLCPISVGYRPEVTLLPTVGPPIQLVHTFLVIGCGKDRNVLEGEPNGPLFPWSNPKIDAETYPLIPGLDPSNPVWTDPEIFVRDDGRPCADDLKTLNNFANSVNNASVPYHLLGPNSNSVTSGGLSALGINDWSPPVIAPGWGSPIPHK
jgi:RHS repeat-associated protein